MDLLQSMKVYESMYALSYAESVWQPIGCSIIESMSWRFLEHKLCTKMLSKIIK